MALNEHPISCQCDGLSVKLLGLSAVVEQRLRDLDIDTLEQLAHIALLESGEQRNEITILIEQELRSQLQNQTVHCYVLPRSASEMQPQLVIESDQFRFVATTVVSPVWQCTCTYFWSSSRYQDCPLFHPVLDQENHLPEDTDFAFSPFLQPANIAASISSSNSSPPVQQRFLEDDSRVPTDMLECNLPIKLLNMSNRTTNALVRADIETIGQLSGKNERELLQIKNFGMCSLQEVREALANVDISLLEEQSRPLPKDTSLAVSAINWNDIRILDIEDEVALQEPDDLSIMEIIDRLLSRIPDREQQILSLRYGLHGGEGCTLEEIGQVLCCTRERARQIEKKAFGTLQSAQNYAVIRPLVHRLVQAIEANYGVLSFESAQDTLCLGEENESISPELLLRFVLRFACEVKEVKQQPILILETEPYSSWTSHVKNICKVLGRVLTEIYAPSSVKELLARFEADDQGKKLSQQVPEKFVVACLKAHPDIIVDYDGMYQLKKWSNKRVDDIIIVLRQHGEALHYKEITRRVNERLPEDQQTNSHNVHNQIGRMTNLFVRVGHGIFGLVEWGLAQDANLADAAYRVLMETGHALEIEQLIDKVLETWHVKRTSVRAAIDLDDRFQQVGRSIYWLAEQPMDTDEQTNANNFDTIFGESLLKRQREFKQIRETRTNTNSLDEARQMGTDLLK